MITSIQIIFYHYFSQNYNDTANIGGANVSDNILAEELPGNIRRFRESIVHGTPQFPMQVYENDFDWYTNRIIDWHWHPEFEFAVVLSGEVLCCINDTCIEVHEGEGFFINSNTMHMERPAHEGEKPLMTTVCFLSDFIGDCGGDLIYRKFVRPILRNTDFKGMKLSPETEWQGRSLEIVRQLFELSQSRTWGYELQYRNMIGELWYLLAVNLYGEENNSTSGRKSGLNEKRLKDMITFIQENFQRELSVDEIARSANISKSECFRCFRSMIDRKPIEFLTEYRLKTAAKLLKTTDMQITEICFSCGFNHMSYFGKLFRRFYGMSPKEFRNCVEN